VNKKIIVAQKVYDKLLFVSNGVLPLSANLSSLPGSMVDILLLNQVDDDRAKRKRLQKFLTRAGRHDKDRVAQ
jgi:hypothetical protein